MIEIIGVAGLAYILLASYSIWYRFEKPILMPFLAFQLLCSIGERKQVKDLPEGIDGLAKMVFSDPLWRTWFEGVAHKGAITQTEYYCFIQRQVVEIDEELTRRCLKQHSRKGSMVSDQSQTTSVVKANYTYRVRAFAPDPRGGDNCFLYDGTVDRGGPIDSAEQIDILMNGLADHIFAQKGVRCSPQSLVLQKVELVGQAAHRG